PEDGTLYYTKNNGTPRVKKVEYHYDGAAFSLGTPVAIPVCSGCSLPPGADGIIFAPDGDLLIGGQSQVVYKVSPTGGHPYQRALSGGVAVFHVMLDPSGKKLWGATYTSS